MDILDQLKKTLEDDFLSKPERGGLRSLLDREKLDDESVNFIRGKMYELAHAKATPANYQFVMQWVKDVNALLLRAPAQPPASDAYFSPGDACRNAIIGQISGAARQLNICVFTISDDQITRAILNAHRRGVGIRVITDNDKSYDHGSDIATLANAGIPMKTDLTPNHMHHKFMVVDDRCVLTGSYNWTNSAARFNHENIVLSREPGIVRAFTNEFSQLWKTMTDYR